MFITPSFKKSLIVEQFQGNYLKAFQELKWSLLLLEVTGVIFAHATNTDVWQEKL